MKMSSEDASNYDQASSTHQAKAKDLSGFFHPKGVAVVGASNNSAKIGYQILNNVIGGGYTGGIYPINPKDEEILGRKAYKRLVDVPGEIDLAVITVPAPYVISVMEDCARKGVKNVAIITSGFGEVGNTKDEDKIKQIADENDIAFLGPNILGLLYGPTDLNATFGPQEVLPGKIAFISQSGALAIAFMGWTIMEKIGLAALCSLGNKADVDERALIEYFNEDDNVDVVLVYMEGLKDGTHFLRTNIKKPVIILKVGRTQRGAKAAASHTGSLSGSDNIFEAAFKQLGVLRAQSFAEAFGWARALSLPLPKGDNALIITNGGGIGVSTTDVCEDYKIGLIDDPEWLQEKFSETMPDFGSYKNPIDITGQGHAKEYGQATSIALKEDRIDTVIVLYCETSVTNPHEIAQGIVQSYKNSGQKKPMVVAMVGGQRTRDALQFLNQNGIPSFSSVEEAISALNVLFMWKKIGRKEKEEATLEAAPSRAIEIIAKAKDEGRDSLLEHEAREVLELCGVPTPRWAFATTLEEALEGAEGMYPLAMKITSKDIIHKTDVGGVELNIKDAEELRSKYTKMMQRVSEASPDAVIDGVNLIQMVSGIECIVGMSQDPQFGSVVMFGLGGVFVEALKDVSFRVVPFGPKEAACLIQDIKTTKIFDGFRGMKADKKTIVQTLCAIQKIAPYVKEVDINPLVTSERGSCAVDARIIL